jgi:hypothetical protein
MDLVENRSGHQLQRLRTYNGGECVNNQFTSHYTVEGIQMQHTVTYTLLAIKKRTAILITFLSILHMIYRLLDTFGQYQNLVTLP